MYDLERCEYAALLPYRYFNESSATPGAYSSGFRYDNETLFYLDFNTFVEVASWGGELRRLSVRFQTRGVLLFTLDFLLQGTLSLQLSAFPSHVKAFFNRLSKMEYVEYRTGLLSEIRIELAAHGVEFKGKS